MFRKKLIVFLLKKLFFKLFTMANVDNRIVVLIDMDCFYCQVEARLNSEFVGKPLAVVQYNQWKLGGIIAVNYEARSFGVTRFMRGEEAKIKCPELMLASVPCLRGKADTSKYRSAGREVIEVLKKNCNIVERASVDEAYLDITQIVDDEMSKREFKYKDIVIQLNNTFVVGYSECGVNNDAQRSEGVETWLSDYSWDIQIQRLAIAGIIVENIRKEIFDITGFRCSAGISFNKILAKLACGLHKPNRQTILPLSSVPDLFATLPIKKVRNLGGKLGDIVIDSLQCNVMSDLLRFSLQYLQTHFDEKTGLRLYNIARGVDIEPVTPRLVSKSIGACKNFPGKLALVDIETLKHWLSELSSEVCERLEQDLEENERKASLLTVSFHYYQNRSSISQSRSCVLTSYKPEKVTEQCLNIVIKATQPHPVSFLGISAGKFVKVKGSENFKNFFKASAIDKASTTVDSDTSKEINVSEVSEESKKYSNNDHNVEISKEINNVNNKKEVSHNKESDISSKNMKPSQTPSPCTSAKRYLKSENFKKSFFMNILKEKQEKIDNLRVFSNIDEKSSKDNNFNMESDNKSNSIDQKQTSTSTSETVLINSDNIKKAEKTCLSNNDEITVGIEEIFPDLNDIDPNIVRLLPPHLQQEVKKLLKTSEVNEKNIDKSKVKTKDVNKYSKGKCLKSKSNKKSNIQTFFIKTDVDKVFDNFKKCPQCDQLILKTNVDAHNDYHVAQNVQKEINQTVEGEESKKRKAMNPGANFFKKRLNDGMFTCVPKIESKSSFFQQ